MIDALRLLFVAVGSRLSQSLVSEMWIVPPAGAYCGAAGAAVPPEPAGEAAAGVALPQAIVNKPRSNARALRRFDIRIYRSPLHPLIVVLLGPRDRGRPTRGRRGRTQ